MSTLTDRLREWIKHEGPITFYDWMKAALYDPRQGYYCRPDRERWGREGDYRTNPERSLLFAATFAHYFAKLYKELGSPQMWTIVEAGAGDGHFAEVLLTTFEERFPEVFAATRYSIDEVSPNSQARIRERMAGAGHRVEFRRLEESEPLDNAIVFSNELLDAFPVHRVVRREGKLREFYVGVTEGGSFEWLIGDLSRANINESLGGFANQLSEGQIVEVNPDIETWLELVSRKMQAGYLVIVDYGAEDRDLYGARERYHGTLRSFRRHQMLDDVLTAPGDHDITSTINWTLVKTLSAKNGFDVVEFDRQDRFLLNAGLLAEMELRVTETRREAERMRLRTCAREMILPGGMAESFHVLVQKKDEKTVESP